ncbi:50S ribosomal protein L13 [Candidatus Roizmanbacteria bacterium]|nr:50S ribosomal protein L13 [Candidatus Roizmanbacteria bacterium]
MVALTKTTKPISAKDIKRAWHVIDLDNQVLGRMSTIISELLQGKHKPTYSPNLDSGDFVVVINTEKVQVSGNKADTKVYTYYSGYPGGLKAVPYKTLMERKPSELIRHAVSGMLPKNKLRDRRLARLFIYPGADHPHKDKVLDNG